MDEMCIFIVNGSLGTRYYDARFHTRNTACYAYNCEAGNEGAKISSFMILKGKVQHINTEYLPA